MAKQTIVVIGATGKQGGSVITSILNDPTATDKFRIRAVTRDTGKDSAKKLAAKGVEVVQADLNDVASLRKAISGAYGVFAVTNFWEVFSGAAELTQGKNIADICAETNVQHLVWSSLPNAKELSSGVLDKVDHFDSKAAVEEYIRQEGIPATFFLPGFYMENLPGQMLRQGEDGKWGLALPFPDDTPIPMFAAESDTGNIVKTIFLDREGTLGRRVLGATEYMTPAQILAAFREVYPVAGRDVAYTQLPPDVFKQIMGVATGADEHLQEVLLQNMRLMSEFGYYGGLPLEPSKAIVKEPFLTWKEYIKDSPVFAEVK